MYAHFNTPAARRAMHRALVHLADVSWLATDIKKIRAETLVVWGSEEAINPVELADLLLKDIPGSRKLIIEKCGHLPMNEAADAFCEGIIGFLDEGAKTE